MKEKNINAEKEAFESTDNGSKMLITENENIMPAKKAAIQATAQSGENTVTGEITELGSADRKVFDLGDGAYKAVYYPVSDGTAIQEFKVYPYDSNNLKVGIDTNGTLRRAYFTMSKPTLVNNPRIKKAELVLRQSAIVKNVQDIKLGLYVANVTQIEAVEDTLPGCADTLIDYLKMKSPNANEIVSYAFDITPLIDRLVNEAVNKVGFAVKLIDEENISAGNCITLHLGSTIDAICPTVEITYESSYGVNTSYRTDAHDLGRFGQGSVDLMCGNLMFESEDFAWQGNRMPVTIKHFYNSALSARQYTGDGSELNIADFSAMNIGKGWKLNIMQSIKPATFIHNGAVYEGYVYTNENGETVCFKKSNDNVEYYEALDGGMTYYPTENKVHHGDQTYSFDGNGRLISISDKHGNTMSITYTSGKITSVTDGAGRIFNFNYSGTKLISIKYGDETSSLVSYVYTGDRLTSITYPTGKKAFIGYNTSGKPASVQLRDASGTVIHKVTYTFTGDRLTSVAEFGKNNAVGTKTQYEYSAAARQTVAKIFEPDDNGATSEVLSRVYTFDDEGNVNSEYAYSEALGNAGTNGGNSGINPNVDGGMNIVSNINNLLADHSFDNLNTGHSLDNLNAWSSESTNVSGTHIERDIYERDSKFGTYNMSLKTQDSKCENNGVYQTVQALPAGEYTFSAYIRVMANFTGTGNVGAFIRVTAADGTVLAESEHLSERSNEYIRLIAPFEISTAQDVTVHILATGGSVVFVDGAQLENNPYANAYNLLEGGNFEYNANKWFVGKYTSLGSDYTIINEIPLDSSENNTFVSSERCFNMSKALKIKGDINTKRGVGQSVSVKCFNSTRETFTLSGWASGYGLPVHSEDDEKAPTFRLRAVLYYANVKEGEKASETFTADFSPFTTGWQFASVEFAKSDFRSISRMEIYCDYDYNFGDAFFDDIQLVRNSIETDLTQEDFKSTATDDDTDTTEETTTEDNTPTFDEAVDAFGNALTETTFTDGEFGSIYRSFGFSENGNDLVRETDASGNNTTYTIDAKTSRNQEITDRTGNKTVYEYDEAGRTTKVINKKADGTEIANVSYTYDAFNNMTEITRGDGMKYSLKYNNFHNLESIGIDGKTDGDLVSYTYKNGNGRLKSVTYANGDKMTATYNAAGQLTHETWTNSNNVEIARYIYTYDGQGNIVRSIDKHALKEYNYYYEDGIIIRAAEFNIVMSDTEMVTSKTVVNSILYTYDKDGNLTKKTIAPTGEEPFTYFYETNNGNTVAKFVADGKTVTCHSKTDSFGRKIFDEIQTGTGFISRQFSYYTGNITDEHVENEKLKSTPTTQLVSQIMLSGGRVLAYEYDAEERITKITDSEEGTTEYTYDALGQLLTETKNGTVVNRMMYNNYGNITYKNGDAYFYDNTWKDRLKQIWYTTTDSDGNPTMLSKNITYDAQGNPTNYFGNPMTWEKGRQLKSVKVGYNTYNYAYNANGIRTGKTGYLTAYKYTLDGTKILKQEFSFNGEVCEVIEPLYDNEDSVCGMIYDGTTYYFQKNLQGDIIAVVDATGEIYGKYSYDAWGKCTIVYQKIGSTVAEVNPFRYRGYYLDSETGFYYLQSRYYDPSTGRFINGDEAGFTCFSNLNAFSYCENNCINNTDKTGFLCGIDDMSILVAGFIVLCGIIIALFAVMSTSEFKSMWYDFCVAVDNGLSWIADAIYNGGKAAWNWTKQQIKAATAALDNFITIARADAKIRSKVRSNSKQRYWSASILKLSNYTYVSISSAISYSQAKARVSSGLCVFTVTRTEARQLASKFPPVVGPEFGLKDAGQYWHYHVEGRKNKSHIFFLF